MSGRDGEPLVGSGFTGDKAALLVDFQLKVGCRGDHPVEGAELFTHESGHLAEVFAFDENGEIVASTHQIAARDLVKTGNALGEPVEASVALGSQLHFDEGGDLPLSGSLRIDDRVVAENGSLGLQVGDHRGDLGLAVTETFRKLRRRETRVFLQEFQKGIHTNSIAFVCLISKTNPDGFRRFDDFASGIDQFQLTHGVLDKDRADVILLVADHTSEAFFFY